MATASEALAAKSTHAPALLAHNEVVGVGVGLLDPTDESQGCAVIVHVKKDLAPAFLESLPQSLTLPSSGGKVPVRIEISGEFFANVQLRQPLEPLGGDTEYSRRIRPVFPGYSLGTPQWSGTVGLIVIDSVGKFQTYVASNNHVLNANNDAGYTEIIQPGGADGGVAGEDKIGRLDRFVKLNNSDNYMDAATAIPDLGSLLDPRYPTVGSLPGHYQECRVGWNLYKVGRTSGAVRGRIDSVHTDVQINYGDYGGLGIIGFKEQISVVGDQPVSLPGDSGSIWLRDDDKRVCAVNFAGSDDGHHSICFPFAWFADAFKVLVASRPLKADVVMVDNVDDPALFSGRLSSKDLAEIKVESF